MKTLYQNPWFRVVQDGRYHYVVEENGHQGAAILPVVAGRDILLLRMPRAAHGGEALLEIPRGCADAGESSLECARRELAEETGYQVAPERMEPLGRIRPNSALLASRVDLYLAHIDESLPALPRDDEADEVVRIPLTRLRVMLREGDIEDAFTLSALALYFNRVE